MENTAMDPALIFDFIIVVSENPGKVAESYTSAKCAQLVGLRKRVVYSKY